QLVPRTIRRPGSKQTVTGEIGADLARRRCGVRGLLGSGGAVRLLLRGCRARGRRDRARLPRAKEPGETRAPMARVMHRYRPGTRRGLIQEDFMPETEVIERARRAAQEGTAPSTQAGEFVHEEIEHIREGKHGARSTKQAIAIGLSKARRAGVKLPPPAKRQSSAATRRRAAQDLRAGHSGSHKTPSRRSRATMKALKC